MIVSKPPRHSRFWLRRLGVYRGPVKACEGTGWICLLRTSSPASRDSLGHTIARVGPGPFLTDGRQAAHALRVPERHAVGHLGTRMLIPSIRCIRDERRNIEVVRGLRLAALTRQKEADTSSRTVTGKAATIGRGLQPYHRLGDMQQGQFQVITSLEVQGGSLSPRCMICLNFRMQFKSSKPKGMDQCFHTIEMSASGGSALACCPTLASCVEVRNMCSIPY